MSCDYRVLFFGGAGTFSRTVLEQLIRTDICIVGVVGYGYGPQADPPECFIPVARPSPGSIMSVAASHQLPTVFVPRFDDPRTLRRLAAYSPDFILSACFPRFLPEIVRRLPRVECLNLHPSMLPAYRGPTPVFWQLRNGECNTGVSLHVVGEMIDAGDVVLQRPLKLADGIGNNEIGKQLGTVGASLFMESLELYCRDQVVPVRQDPASASYFASPGAVDFSLSTKWPARRAFNFIRGTTQWGKEYRVVAGDQVFLTHAAKDYQEFGELGSGPKDTGEFIFIQFTPGILCAVGALAD